MYDIYMVPKDSLILLSAGGTGGHMTPAMALSHALAARGYKTALLTDVRGSKYAPMFGDIPVHVLPSGTAFPGVMGKLKGLWDLARGTGRAIGLIRKFKPAVIVGFGGYPSVPGILGGQLAGVPTILHEQNAVIGKANHFLRKRAARIAVSMEGTAGLSDVPAGCVVHTGNPVRPEIAALAGKPYRGPEAEGPLKLLVMGGSLGAKVFSDMVPAALSALPPQDRARISIIQQCRADAIETVRAQYKDSGIKAELHEFITDVAGALDGAHLVIARSGASSVAEITAAGRPAIFVPYPHHKDQQQKKNAELIADAGGAWVMTESGFTAQTLMARLESFLQNPAQLVKSAAASKTCGRPGAAGKLADVVLDLM